jgi:hypothetical protein
MEDGAVEAVVSDDAAVGSPELLTKRETLELVQAYYKIADPAIRKRLFELARSLSNLGRLRDVGNVLISFP